MSNAKTEIARPRARMGRPPLPASKARSIVEKFRITEGEREAIKRASERNNLDRSEWMRQVLLSAAQAA